MATIKVFTSNGQRGVMAELVPRFERATGHRVETSYDPGQIMMRRIAAGETADVVMLGGSALDDLAKQGKLLADTRRAFSSCGIGVAVAPNVPKPDISTVDAFKRAILAAKTVAYTIEGASGIHFSGLIERLGHRARSQSQGSAPARRARGRVRSQPARPSWRYSRFPS